MASGKTPKQLSDDSGIINLGKREAAETKLNFADHLTPKTGKLSCSICYK